MPDTQLVTAQGAVIRANRLKTAWAAGKVRLVQSPFIPSVNSTAAQLAAAEATFDGYTAGGYAVTAFTGPQNADGGGAIITGPVVSPTYGPAGTPPVTNIITGWWYENATAGVEVVGVFATPRNMGVVGDGFNLVIQDTEGKNPTPTF